jgi:hypothetical protein
MASICFNILIKEMGKGLSIGTHKSVLKDQVKGGLLLDIVVCEGTFILQLLASKNQALLIGRDSFLVLDLLLDTVDGIGGLYLQRDGLPSERLDKDLH